jgi:proline dehydrogenase
MRLPFVLARRFVAAETIEGALPVLRDLRSRGLHTTVDLLGEYVRDRAVAAQALNMYVDLAHRLAEDQTNGHPNRNISVKLSMMGQKIDESFCLDNLTRLLDAASDLDVFVRLDMEGSDVTDSTMALFEEVYPRYRDHVGIVLQAYLHRTARDVERMCELGARVRLCKGAYKEPASKAYQDMATIRTRFLDYMRLLLKEGNYPGIATHDDRLIAATRDFARAADIPPDRYEFQMLYGIRTETQEQIASDGYRMRVYVPYGRAWLPYFSRRLRERRENVWFVLKNLFRR